MAFYLFILLIFLAPVVVCYSIYKLHITKADTVSGQFRKISLFKLTGVGATYSGILIATISLFLPNVLNFDFNSIKTNWNYTLSLHQIDPISHQSKTIRIEYGKAKIARDQGDIISVYAPRSELINLTHGLANEEKIFIPLVDPSDNISTSPAQIIAYGTYNRDQIYTKIYYLADSNPKSKTNVFYGFLTFTRIWPFGEVLFLIFLPLITVLLLNRIGSLVSSVQYNFKFPTVLSKILGHILPVFNFKLNSAVVCYLIVYAVLFFLFHHSNSHPSNQGYNSYTVCKVIEGKWENEYYQYNEDSSLFELMAIGNLSVLCPKNPRDMSLLGEQQVLIAKKKNNNNEMCYEISPLQTTYIHVDLMGIIHNKLYGVYELNHNPYRLGFLIATIQKNQITRIMDFYDFHHYLYNSLLKKSDQTQLVFDKSKRLTFCRASKNEPFIIRKI